MDSTLSIVCNTESVLVARLRRGEKGLELSFMELIDEWVDLSREDFMTSSIVKRLTELIGSMSSEVGRVRISLPSGVLLRQRVPFMADTSTQETLDLLNLELMQNAPGKSMEQYDVQFYALRLGSDKPSTMLTIMTELQAMQHCEQLVMQSGVRQCSFVARHSCVQNAYRYNYPERKEESVALIGIHCDEVEITLMHQGHTAAFNICPIRDGREPDVICKDLVDDLISNTGVTPQSVMLYGDGLRPASLHEVQQLLQDRIETVERLNAFRMCTTTLSEPQRQLAARMAHRFAVAVGSVLPTRHAV